MLGSGDAADGAGDTVVGETEVADTVELLDPTHNLSYSCVGFRGCV